MKQKPVKDISLTPDMSIKNLMKQFGQSGGFTATKLATGVDILKKMIMDKECTVFLSFPACIIATGTRGVITELINMGVITNN